MSEIIKFIPTHCPACSEPLSIDRGKKEDVIKLVCTNKSCIGTQLKRLQKGIIALEIRGLGPSTIEKLLHAGITHSYDLFDESKLNESVLISSGYFQKGRALTKIIDAVKNTKQIPINKAILSLQIENIGKTFSEKIGQKLSNVFADFSSLMLDIREELEDDNSELNSLINSSLDKFREFDVEITLYEKPKEISKEDIKKINKVVYFTGFSNDENIAMSKTVKTDLSWDVKEKDYELLIRPDKKYEDAEVLSAKENGVKIMTWKQIKLLFL